jgi:molybdopterin converting factor small subunit
MVAVRLPALLAQLTGGARDYEAQGETIAALLVDLAAREPQLGAHLFDEAGAIRRNIQFVHNDAYVRNRDAPSRPLAPGDRLQIMNAVSGG